MNNDTSSYGTSSATSPAKKTFIANAASKAYTGPSIVDFLKASGYGSDLASRTALGKEYGIDYSTTKDNYATQNTALLNALRGIGAGPSDTSSSGAPAGSGNSSSGGTTTTPAPQTPSAVDTAFADYISSLKGGTEATKARKAYNDFIANRDQGIVGLEGQGRGIPLTLIRGQQAKLQQQSGIEANRLQNDITIAENADKAVTEANKARYEFEKGKIEAIAKNNPAFELSPGQERYTYDPKTGGYIKTASATPGLKEISAGATLYDPATGKPIYTAPKTTSGSGTTTTTKNTIAAGEAKLNAARGADGWTDPYLYKQAYEDWVNSKMGTAQQFLAKFPPKNYVNPEASKITGFPAYLQNNTKKSSGRTL